MPTVDRNAGMGKLTKRFIEAAAPKDKAYILWDGDIPGFGVRVHPSGRKAFVLQYRIGRRSRTMSLGYTQVITPDKARGMAIALSSPSRTTAIRSPSAKTIARRSPSASWLSGSMPSTSPSTSSR
jgi:hypothetical protein